MPELLEKEVGEELCLGVDRILAEVFAARLNHLAANFDSDVTAYRILFVMGSLTVGNLGL